MSTTTYDLPMSICQDCLDPAVEHCRGRNEHCACSCRTLAVEYSIIGNTVTSGAQPRDIRDEKLLAALIAIDIARIAGNRDATAQDFVDLAYRIVERVRTDG